MDFSGKLPTFQRNRPPLYVSPSLSLSLSLLNSLSGVCGLEINGVSCDCLVYFELD